MLFNGAGVAEQMDMSANGERLRFFRNPGQCHDGPNGVEGSTSTLSAAPTVTVNDLSGTDVMTRTSTSQAPSAALLATAQPTRRR